MPDRKDRREPARTVQTPLEQVCPEPEQDCMFDLPFINAAAPVMSVQSNAGPPSALPTAAVHIGSALCFHINPNIFSETLFFSRRISSETHFLRNVFFRDAFFPRRMSLCCSMGRRSCKCGGFCKLLVLCGPFSEKTFTRFTFLVRKKIVPRKERKPFDSFPKRAADEGLQVPPACSFYKYDS